ncbi:transmembrane protein 250-like [Garra rufa]|uniref:transmembrane protein 250-like n=1 Tax=Garra rufa TaxID=137080 RepID=UPI003CCE6C0B
MPVIPIPRRVRSFHGPHTTCMHSACGPARTAQLVRTKYNNFDLYLKSRWMYSFVRFLLYFGCSLFTSLLWVALSALFCLQYISVRIFLRLQYKLSVILLLLYTQIALTKTHFRFSDIIIEKYNQNMLTGEIGGRVVCTIHKEIVFDSEE